MQGQAAFKRFTLMTPVDGKEFYQKLYSLDHIKKYHVVGLVESQKNIEKCSKVMNCIDLWNFSIN